MKQGQKYRNATRAQIVEIKDVIDNRVWYYCLIVKREFVRQKDSFTNLYILVE